MAAVQRGVQHETDVLIRQVDGHLALLRARRHGHDLELAERLAECLRDLIAGTTHSSAADRAHVRAAVHYFVLRGEGRRRRSLLASGSDQRMVNEVARHLGRLDLVVEMPGSMPPDRPARQVPTGRPRRDTDR